MFKGLEVQGECVFLGTLDPFKNIRISHKKWNPQFYLLHSLDIINTVALVRNGAKSADMLVSYHLLYYLLFSNWVLRVEVCPLYHRCRAV